MGCSPFPEPPSVICGQADRVIVPKAKRPVVAATRACCIRWLTNPPFFPMRQRSRIDRGLKLLPRPGPLSRAGIIPPWIAESTPLDVCRHYIRQREYLTESEVDKLLATAGDSRNPVRDRLLVLMAFRHAFQG